MVARDVASVLWLVIKIAIVLLFMNSTQTFFLYQNF